jgi:hypothetical protein
MEVHHIALKKYNFWLKYTGAAAEKLISDIQKQYDWKMNYKTKERISKMIIYTIIGFASAFFWHKTKEK